MHKLDFMGHGVEEEFRGRIYGAPVKADERVAFVRRLATVGVIDCPAYDPWVEALQERGWLPPTPKLEANPDGPGRIGRWALTPFGLEQWAAMAREHGWAS